MMLSILCGGLDYRDNADQFGKWVYLTATDVRFDIGHTVLRALSSYQRHNCNSLKNGQRGGYNADRSLMRILPLVFYLDREPSVYPKRTDKKNLCGSVNIALAHIRCMIACETCFSVA